MTRVAWITDIHLDFLDEEARDAFYAVVDDENADAILLGGDITTALDLQPVLRAMAARIRAPIYYVLGNHDFYRGSIAEVRAEMSPLCEEVASLHWLPNAGVLALAPGVGLIGQDGWGDGRVGDFLMAPNKLNDYRLIQELTNLSPNDRLAMLNALGDEAAAAVRDLLPSALAQYSKVVFLTHVPPWRDACVYEGKPSDDEWAPHFTCKAVGDAILEIMAGHPEHQLAVLCGHSHGANDCRMADNVRVVTGGAEYERPAVQRSFDFQEFVGDAIS
jgi:Icc-related predicted phosphoesterase